MGWLHRRRSGHSDRHRYTTRRFGRATVTIDVELQTVEVVGDAAPAERDDVTRWALRMLRSIGMPVSDPLSLRDALWK